MTKEPMTKEPRDIWLKVLIGFIITSIMALATVGFANLEKKVDKEVFKQHEKYQTQQYKEIKSSLIRIEGKL